MNNNKKTSIKLRKNSKINSKSLSSKVKIKKNLTNIINKYNILNSFFTKPVKFKINREKSNNNYNNINTISQKNKEIIFYKNEMPYIPSKEKQKSELNFIRLIKTLMDNNQKNTNKKNDKNLNNDISIEDPYKPKGYNYYNYSREHPTLVNDSKDYIKIVQELNRRNDNKNNEKRCLSYSNIDNNEIDNNIKLYNSISNIKANKNINETNINKLKSINSNIELNDSVDNNNIKNKEIIPISKFNSRYSHTLSNDNLINAKNKNISTDELKFGTIKNNLPIISSRQIQHSLNIDYNNNNKKMIRDMKGKADYNYSDIFNLKNDENTFLKDKNKAILLYNQYILPMKDCAEKKTSINEVGWCPKDHNLKSRISTSSVAFNIISPSFKNISPTKKDIDAINNNNSYKSNLMSGFIDMCKPGDSELRKDYINKLNSNKNIFHRKNYCSSLYDIHHDYKDLVLDVF
jgi:hypothetical protein